jgi:hypothetical protein
MLMLMSPNLLFYTISICRSSPPRAGAWIEVQALKDFAKTLTLLQRQNLDY